LLNHRPMDDPLKVMAMKFLAKLEFLMQMTKPAWQPIVTVKMIQLSINHGLSPMSPLGESFHCSILHHKFSFCAFSPIPSVCENTP